MQVEVKKTGYLGIKNAISLQEFMAICNMIRDINERVPADRVELNIVERTPANIKQYLQNTSKPLEQLITDLTDSELYYFTFENKDITYKERKGFYNYTYFKEKSLKNIAKKLIKCYNI